MEQAVANRILAAVDEGRVIALEQALIRIPSETLNETPLALYIAKYMKAAGLEVQMQVVPISDKAVGVQPVGRLRGKGSGPALLFCGHMDYMGLSEPERWRHPPFAGVLEDGFIYGRGAKDEKAGLCAAIAAAETLAMSRVELNGDLIIAPVVGHKTKFFGGGLGARHLMTSGVTADMAIITENSNLGIATTCVGRVTARLHMSGTESSFGTKGTDFYNCLARLINRLGPNFGTVAPGGWLTFEPNSSFPDFPKLVYEGVETSMGSISARDCTVTVNVRIVPGQTADSVEADLKRVLATLRDDDADYRSRAEILHPVRYPHVISINDPLVEAIARAHNQVRGNPPEIGLGPRHGAVDDAWFLIEGGLTRTTVYGPGSPGLDFTDIPDERIAVKDLVDCTRIYALTAAIVCGVA